MTLGLREKAGKNCRVSLFGLGTLLAQVLGLRPVLFRNPGQSRSPAQCLVVPHGFWAQSMLSKCYWRNYCEIHQGKVGYPNTPPGMRWERTLWPPPPPVHPEHRPTHRPQVFSIAVFGPIINEGYVNAGSGPELRCVFNGNAGACRFGVALGLGAFLACAAFLMLDLRFQQISSVRDRRRAVLLDLGFSGGRGPLGAWAWCPSSGREPGPGRANREARGWGCGRA